MLLSWTAERKKTNVRLRRKKKKRTKRKKIINKKRHRFCKPEVTCLDLRRKPADHFIVVWLSSNSVFNFFLPHSFLTGTNERTQSSADNSLCNLTGRTLLLYNESYRFVTFKNVFVILFYFSFVSVIRRRVDCLRRICIVTSKVFGVLLSSACLHPHQNCHDIFFSFVFNGQQTFPDILNFTDSL